MFRIFITALLLTNYGIYSSNLIEVFKWKQFEIYEELKNDTFTTDFLFPDAAILKPERNRVGRLDFDRYNNVPMGLNHFRGKLFITMPRRNPGIPATLSVIYLDKVDPTNKSPKITGYPSYEMNTIINNPRDISERIVSVYRTRIDSCNRMWFVDTGMLEYTGNRQQVKPPSIWIINLEDDSVIMRFRIPARIVTDGRGLASITVDVNNGNCNDAYAYIPDLYHYQLHVYRLSDNNTWSFNHNYFSFDPLLGDLSIGYQNFTWNDGIFSITLGKVNPDGFRTAYFHALASNEQFAVSTSVLRNETNAERDSHGTDFKHLGKRGSLKQSTIHDYDPKTGVIFYDEISQNGVGCWNTKKPMNPDNVCLIDSDRRRMIYPSDLIVDSEGTLWVMTNSLPIFIYSFLNPDYYNFRVWKIDTTKAIQNTVCQ